MSVSFPVIVYVAFITHGSFCAVVWNVTKLEIRMKYSIDGGKT